MTEKELIEELKDAIAEREKCGAQGHVLHVSKETKKLIDNFESVEGKELLKQFCVITTSRPKLQ